MVGAMHLHDAALRETASIYVLTLAGCVDVNKEYPCR